MGELIRLTCSGCGADREECLGIGRSLEGTELCACYRCRRYVRKKIKLVRSTTDPDLWSEVPDVADLKCPYCRKSVRPLEAGDQCPICESAIELQPIGIWD